MGRFRCLTFLLIALSCYALSSSKSIRTESHQASKKVDVPNRISTEPGQKEQQQQQQFSHAMKEEARRKRSQREFGIGGEYRDLNDILDDLEDNSVAAAAAAAVAHSQEFDLESLSPLTYYLLLQKIKQLQSNEPTYRVRTPRLGRSIDFQLLDAVSGGGGGSVDGGEDVIGGGGGGGISVPRQLVSRVIKKSVPFKPRLGKRTQTCD